MVALGMYTQTMAPEARLGHRRAGGGCPQERVGLVFHSLVIGHGTEWRPVMGSRHVMVEGKQGGRAADVGFVTGDPQAIRRVFC